MKNAEAKTNGKVGRAGLDPATVDAMRADYLRLKSLRKTGELWGRTRQAMWELLKRRKATRPQKKHDEPVWYRGRKYTPAKDGYLRRTCRKGHQEDYLQRVVWMDAHGPIPKGHQIRFKDGDRSNCALENLECLPMREVVSKNSSGLNGAIKKKMHQLALSMGPYIAGQARSIAAAHHADPEELKQVGHLAAMKIAQKFDPNRGAGFYGYSYLGIRREMLNQAKRGAAALSGPLTRVSQIRAASLDAPVGDEADSATLGELVGRDEDVTHSALRHETRVMLAEAMGRLSKRERIVIEARFIERRTFEDIAAQLGVTRQRIQQIENEALATLRHSKQLKKLAA